MQEPKAFVVLIDNSANAIDGDFYPSRLEAQKTTVERLSDYLLNMNPRTQFALGTLGSHEFGIRTSFTSEPKRLNAGLQSVSSGGKIEIEKGLKSALLAFSHADSEIEEKRILLFVGSDNNLSSYEAKQLGEAATQKGIRIDVVVFGKELFNWQNLKFLNSKMKDVEFLKIPEARTILSDAVLVSQIGPGRETKVSMNATRKNPILAEAARSTLISYKEQSDVVDPEIEEQIQILTQVIDVSNNQKGRTRKKRSRDSKS